MTDQSEVDGNSRTGARQMLSKVPEVTIYFWIIKILATTVGETFADFLNVDLGFGLTLTTIVMVGALAVALFFQFKADRYVPRLYWLAVTLISVAGTLITDNLTDRFGVPLALSTGVFAVLLVGVFVAWYRSEKTLSIHSIRSTKREAYYWLAILFTFALGTAAGDWTAEGLALGFGPSAAIYALLIGLVVVVHYVWQKQPGRPAQKATRAVATFWVAYVLTRPLGASLGDLLSQPSADGGLGLTTTGTSALFLITILGLVMYLTRSKRDQIALSVVD